jgi:hypothetical protein
MISFCSSVQIICLIVYLPKRNIFVFRQFFPENVRQNVFTINFIRPQKYKIASFDAEQNKNFL